MQLSQNLSEEVLEFPLVGAAAVAGLFELSVQDPDQAPLLSQLLLCQRLPAALCTPQMLLQVLSDLSDCNDVLRKQSTLSEYTSTNPTRSFSAQ